MSSKWFTVDESDFRSEYVYQPHEDKLYRKLTQPNEDAILAHNAELRKQEQRKLDWGRYVGSIPNNILEKWKRENPELRSPDAKIRSAKLMQLMREHPEVLVVDKSKL